MSDSTLTQRRNASSRATAQASAIRPELVAGVNRRLSRRTSKPSDTQADIDDDTVDSTSDVQFSKAQVDSSAPSIAQSRDVADHLTSSNDSATTTSAMANDTKQVSNHIIKRYLCGRHWKPTHITASEEDWPKSLSPDVWKKAVEEGQVLHDEDEEERYRRLTNEIVCDSHASGEAHNSRCYALLDYDSIPTWLRDNEYLHSGYRVNIGWRNSCDSMCHLHNETMNVWTHFLGFTIVAILLCVTLGTISPFGIDRLNLGVALMDSNSIASQTANRFQQASDTIRSYLPESIKSGLQMQPLDKNKYLLNDTSADIVDPTFDRQQLHDMMNNVQRHLPIMAEMTDALRAKVASLESALSSASEAGESVVAAQYNAALDTMTQRKAEFQKYIESLESKFDQATALLGNTTYTKASMDALLDVRTKLNTQFGSFFNTIAQPHFDVLSVTKQMMDDFTAQVASKSGFASSSEPWMSFIPLANIGSQIDELIVRMTGTSVMTPSQQYNDTISHRVDEETGQIYGLQAYLPRWPLAVFMLTAMCCLLFSAIFHLFNAVSQKMALLLQCLDYAGISLLISGSNIPVIYYGFWCAPKLRFTYLTITTVLGLTVFTITILPRFRPVKYRELKTALFIGLGLSGIAPLTHLMLHFGRVHFIFWYLLAMGAFYLLGAAIYLTRIPERWSPGKFDIWFSSHQLWHTLILVAVLTLYTGLIHFYEWRMHKVCKA